MYDNTRLNAVTVISHARLLFIAIQSSSEIGVKDKDYLLNVWERVTFRIFGIAKKDSRFANGDYIRLSHKIFNSKLKDVIEISNEIKSIGNSYPIENTFITLLQERDCYNGWEMELRYFFYRYEEYLSKQNNIKLNSTLWEHIWNTNVNNSIEHIFPQNPDSSSWSGKFGIGKNVIINNVHRLGNLVLLPPEINSKASRLPFSDKKKLYKKVNLLILKDIVNKHDWNREQVDNREKELLKFAIETWGVTSHGVCKMNA